MADYRSPQSGARRRVLMGTLRTADTAEAIWGETHFRLSEETAVASLHGSFSLIRSGCLRLRQKLVSHTPHRHQMSRIPGIILDIPPQPHHKIINRAGVGVFVQPPHLFEDL